VGTVAGLEEGVVLSSGLIAFNCESVVFRACLEMSTRAWYVSFQRICYVALAATIITRAWNLQCFRFCLSLLYDRHGNVKEIQPMQ
jgi:hypothetical protein